jgi:hypothetical protein
VELESFGGISLDTLVEDLKLFIPLLNGLAKRRWCPMRSE